VQVSIRLTAQCRRAPVNSDVKSHVVPVSVLSRVCELLARGEALAAADCIRTHYPPPLPQSPRGTWSPTRAMRVFLRDGFTDRYSGSPLVFPGTLHALSVLLPDVFPYQKNWRQSDTHSGFWELYPTIDHVIPLARGGSDEEKNVVTTSMVRNAAKANWLLAELGWNSEPAPLVKDWDGLVASFLTLYEHSEIVRTHPRTKAWHRILSHAT